MPHFTRACRVAYGVVIVCLLSSAQQKPPQRPRILGIDHVTLYVSDLEKSRHFYSDVFRLTTRCPQYTGPDPCYLVAPSDQRILLEPALQTKMEARKNWLAEIAFATDNLAALRG